MTLQLAIGQKYKSSWTLRAWIILRHLGLEFEEVPITLDRPDTKNQIAPYSPSGWIPALRDGDLTVWDSLAIAEYLAQDYPQLWPSDRTARALARSVCAEMHSGFANLRQACPMDLTIRASRDLDAATGQDVSRIVALTKEMRQRFGHGGPFMFGPWTVADAFYTPVATRFRSYRIDLSRFGDDVTAQAYADALLGTPAFLEWERDALALAPTQKV